MGQPAAAFGDPAAHGGFIIIGSPNVFISGRPAARKSDNIVCPLHGTSTITKGSATVFVNGLPAARMGDTTGCLVPGLPPVLHHSSLASDKEQSVEEFEKNGGELSVYAEHKQSDANQDGVMDTNEYAAGLSRMKGVMGPARVGKADISGSIEYGAANISAKTTKIIATSSLFSMDDGVEFSGLKGSANLAVGEAGTEGRNAALKLGATGQVAHGEIKNKIYIGSDAKKAGIMLDGGAAYEDFKGEMSGTRTDNIPFLTGYNIQRTAKLSGSAGSLGLTRAVLLMWNKEEHRLYMGMDLGIHVGFGLEGAFEVSVGQEYQKEATPPGFGPAGIPGIILLGQPRVLVG
ncbi:MAG: hypothetical protein EOO56_02245 [Hymenobacter sp.]|nr:MAG: hypothetical protein EOO56_02245 [Hymenobacter sp.]